MHTIPRCVANIGFMLLGGLLLSRAGMAQTPATELGRRMYGIDDLRKRVAVVQTPAAPTIDGVMQPGEWDAAAAITGLTVGTTSLFDFWGLQNIAGDQSSFWITYDNENLYIAHHSPPPARIKGNQALIPVMLKRTETGHDGNTDWDDSIRISIQDPYPGGDEYWIYVNSIGTTYEFAHGSGTHSGMYDTLGKPIRVPGSKLEGGNLSWDPRVRNASTLTLDGWTIEVAIPWQDFGPYITRPAPGGMLHMNFVRLWKEVMKEDHIWAMFDCLTEYKKGGAGIPLPAGEVLFQGEKGVVVQLDETGNLPRGEAAFGARLTNRDTAARTVKVAVSTDSGELQDAREIVLQPGGSVPYAFKGRITNFATTTIALTVTDAATGEVLHVTTLPVIRKTKPDIYTRRYRSTELLKFETDLAFIGAADLKKTRVTLTVTRPETKQRVFTKTFQGFTSYDAVFELSTLGWAAGAYEVQFVFKAPGMKTYETTLPYEHAPLPVWWQNHYGYQDMEADKVPYPWTALAVKDETVSCWGREYRFGKRLFPEQIMTLDAPLLRAPMRLIAKTEDGKVLDSTTVEVIPAWTTTRHTRIEGERMLDAGTFSLKNNFWAEYDGLVWNTLTLVPKEKVVISSLELEIPLTQAFTDVINTYDYSLRNTGKLKPAGYTGPISPLWLGNGEGGLQWLCETDGPFFVKDPRKIVRVEVTPDGATLRIVMIDIPTAFDSPHAISFGFNATPVRPKTWRTPEHTTYRGTPTDSGGGAAWYPEGYEMVPAADPGHGRGDCECLYVFASSINPRTDAAGTDDFKYFGDEWLANASQRLVPGDHAAVTQASRSYRDWFVWRHWRYQQKYGYGGLYYDGSAEISTNNPYAATPYRKRDGSPAGTAPFLATRDVYKRLYNITLSNPNIAARDAWIGLHHSGMPNMAYLAFGTQSWDGENFNSIINAQQPTYRGVVDPALFRAQLMGHNFGWPTRFLGQGRVKRASIEAAGGAEAVYDQLTGLVLLHDSMLPNHEPCCIAPGGSEIGLVANRLYNAIGKHNFYHWAFQFIPYWRQDIVTLPNSQMYASWYVAQPARLRKVVNPWEADAQALDGYFDSHLPWDIKLNNRRTFAGVTGAITMAALPPHKAILIVYNNSDWAGEMRLKPDWQKLGFASTDGLSVENAVHSTGFRLDKVTDKDGKTEEKAVFFPRPEEFARVENGELIFPMTKWNYRMIVVEKK